MEVRIMVEFTGRLIPDRIYIVQIGRRGFFGTKWTDVKGFESLEKAKKYAKLLE